MYSDLDSDNDVSYIVSSSDSSDLESSYSSTDEDEVIDAVQMDDWTTIMDPFEDKLPRSIPEFQSNYDFHPAIDFEDCMDAVNCFEAFVGPSIIKKKLCEWTNKRADKYFEENPQNIMTVFGLRYKSMKMDEIQTGCSIQCRVKEHRRDVEQGNTGKSAVTELYHTGSSHVIDYNDVKIQARSNHYYRHIVRESLEKMVNPNNSNREDGYRLSKVWKLALESAEQQRPSKTDPRLSNTNRGEASDTDQMTITDTVQRSGTDTHHWSAAGTGYITRSGRHQHQSLENF
ncbi:hypothetical protein MML48_3g00007670 [Holotrichia oblita]|uniref:Uncharacterized protein n=1 Tax=Holotrichia oblita TaxID=644536 RepID=A0ACB9TF43_HOLOL|nr:hypothetical protein MML48_3g00007670 [Holotrichia oblita]